MAEDTAEPNFELVLERLASEFYRSPEVLRAVARKILEQKERKSP